jgi:hypothetical protein
MPILAVFLCALPLVPQDPELVPKLDACRLVVQDKELAPLRSSEGPGFESARSGWEFAITKREIRFRRAGSKDDGGKITAPVELELKTLAGDVAWFVERKWSWEPGKLKPEVHRLDLLRSGWLPVGVLDDKALGLEPPVERDSNVTSLLAVDGAIYLVRRVYGDQEKGIDGTYVVARIDASSLKCDWARRFPLCPAPEESGAVLMAPMRTRRSHPWSTDLCMFGPDLLVCVGGAESVLELDAKKGQSKWEVERVWEYQRGYIGPSVWSHYLSRFGRETLFHDTSETQAAVRESRKRFEALYSGTVIAGPFLVDRPSQWGTDRGLLVIAEVDPRDPFGGYLGQQYAFEISAEGKPASVVALPRSVLGWTAMVEGDHVVFACQRGAFACVGTTENTGDLSMEVGNGPDATGCVRWFRELRPSEHAAWMSCDPAGDPVALDARLGVRPAGGGWIERQGDTLFHFPLWVLDPRDGRAREVELRAPFEGSMSAPTENSMTENVGGTDHIRTWGWRGLALTRLELAGDKLLVWIANSKQVWRLEFDSRELQPAK